MFEVETQNQLSLETGAPDDVTMSTAEMLKQCQEQIKRLETENKVLHGRIRGYKTLGDLLQEAKEENKKLSEEKKELSQRLDTFSSITESLSDPRLENPRDQEVPKKTEVRQTTDMTQKIDQTQKVDKTQLSEFKSRTEQDEMKERSVASVPENSKPSEPADDAYNSIREVTPMQESMSEMQNDLSRTIETEKSEIKERNMTKNLELDSDRYEEPEYEKIRKNEVSKPGSMSSMSVISSGPDEKYNFPSLSSGTPHAAHDVRPKVYNDFDTKPSTSIHDSELSMQMRRMLQMSSTESGQDLAVKFRKMSEDIAKTEENAKKYKSLAYTFAQENQKLKTSLTMEIKGLKNQNYELKEENNRLLAMIKAMERTQENLSLNDSLISQTQVIDWVKVTKPRRQELDSELFQQGVDDTSLTGDMDSIMANIRHLRKQNKELKDANQSWNRRWQELTKDWEVKVDQMKREVNQYKQDTEEAVRRERQLQMEAERMVSNAKAQAHEEENAKEDALNKLHQMTNQMRALQEQSSEIEMKLDCCVREKHILEAEISVLKSRSNGSEFGARSRAIPCVGDRSYDDLKTEIEVLRQQLTVFEEDFDRERQDRAAAQSTRDELEKTLESVVQEKEVVSRKVRQLDQKLKGQESVMQQTLKRNENLQSQIRDLQTRNQQLLEQLQASAMNQAYQMRYQPVPMYANQPVQGLTGHVGGVGLTPQAQMGAVGLPPQSPQTGYNYQHMPIHNQQMPFMNFQQPMTPVATPVDRNTGHWNCHECTFSNIPSRTVCEMCGRLRRQTESSLTEPVLMSRDVIHQPPLSRGKDVPDENSDLVTDTGIFQ